jgi:succinate dehydrogenase/fumarate reductase flavoprotein subunit
MNPDMLRRYAPEISRTASPIGNPNDDGSGIRMGEAAGGALLHMNQCFLTIPCYPPSSLTFGILVNAQGQRFVNEDVYHARIAAHIHKQLGEGIYLIIGEKHWNPRNILGGEIVGTGETIEEVAEEIGLPVENLSHTVHAFNEHAARGEDPVFHKQAEWLAPIEPTIAAVDLTPGRHGNYFTFSLGGLSTRPTGEVLRMDGESIPGLYAAGRTTCGLPRTAEGYASGLSVGDVTFFGRLAGRQAAARKR